MEEFPKAPIGVNIVWTNVLPSDGLEPARRAAADMNDSRVRHFYDPDNRAGKAISRSLGWRWVRAWDIYLFYDNGADWRADPPRPMHWMHQLRYLFWDTHVRTGDDLVAELRATMRRLDGADER